MDSPVHFFTSVTSNYLPKARVLARSVKAHLEDASFHLVLSDDWPDDGPAQEEPFDSVITIDALGIDDFNAWVFKHSVVELCTAVKGLAFLEIFRRHDAGKVFFLDPDMLVMGDLAPMVRHLDSTGVLLTPHLTRPEQTPEAILDNEISCLKHGAFNLGFLGISTAQGGDAFLDWWCSRLVDYCYDDIPGGLFTDQKWVDLAPAFFPDISILRDTAYNLATWNIAQRKVEGSLSGGITVDGNPLIVYHFSGFDSGAQKAMLDKYGAGSRALEELRQWYITECDRMGQTQLGNRPSKYAFFDSGETITGHQRLLYRLRPDLQQTFPDPYRAQSQENSYLAWYRAQAPAEIDPGEAEVGILRARLMRAEDELRLLKGSRRWRFSTRLLSLMKSFQKTT